MTNLQILNQEFNSLINNNFQKSTEESIWVQNKMSSVKLPDQGFKLHISSTVTESSKILSRVIELLSKYNVVYKTCKSISELKKINTGLFYGQSQIGKFITIYPQTEQLCKEIAYKIHEHTKSFKVVQIPNDIQLLKNSNVFYRYGLFNSNKDNKLQVGNKAINDSRKYGDAIPKGIKNIFPLHDNAINLKNILLIKALSQRGKGGVFVALEKSNHDFINYILKEGIRHGELMEDGLDGFERLKNEENVLHQLAGLDVPKVLGNIKQGENYYLKLEQIYGEGLGKLIKKSKTLMSFDTFSSIALKAAILLEKIHHKNIIWCDCKPDNIIYNNKTKKVSFIDFEGAQTTNSKTLINWSSPGFAETSNLGKSKIINETYDLYSFGATLFFMITKKILSKDVNRSNILKVRRRYPRLILKIIYNMLDSDASKRPKISEFINELSEF